MKSRLMALSVVLVLIVATLGLFDVAAWFLVPRSLTTFATSYRRVDLLSGGAGHPTFTRPYPRHYYRADAKTGFDIAPGARASHAFDLEPLAIWANALGCFDRNETADFSGKPYTYFAGDSFTWGYADYESKFATVWEKRTGHLAAKCGVTHTGQHHQLEKLRRFVAAVGRQPETVFVGFYVNDPANDAAYPHSTVIGGYQVDTVFVKDGALVRADPGELRAAVEEEIRRTETPPAGLERAKTYVWIYSLSANIALHGARAAQALLQSSGDSHAPGASLNAAAAKAPAPSSRPTSRFGDNLYYWHDPRTIRAYAGDPKTAANRAAILEWARDAKQHRYRLVFLLFPPREIHDDPSLFDSVRAFLDASGVEHLDFARLFREGKLGRHDLYWRTNGHWNAEGNRTVGRLLAERNP